MNKDQGENDEENDNDKNYKNTKKLLSLFSRNYKNSMHLKIKSKLICAFVQNK